MTMRNFFNNIQDMLQYAYGYGQGSIRKDAPVITTTTGVYNAIFGALAFYQLNTESTAFAILPKYVWPRSGFRAITADSGTVGDGGVAENGTIPATLKPTFAEITMTTKQVAHAFDMSLIQSLKSSQGDDAISWDAMRKYFAIRHVRSINLQLLRDVDDVTSQTTDFESIDRVCSNDSEGQAILDSNDNTIYGLDRDSGATWADAVVSHNTGTDRFLSDALILSTLATLEANGARTNLILTGSDTKTRIWSIYNNQVRYQGALKKDAMAQITLNGVTTDAGMEAGVRIATLYDIPMFVSQDVVKDTISRLYFLDTTSDDGYDRPRLGIAMAFPTMYYESGMNAANPDPFPINRFGTEGVYFTAGELACVGFRFQGKIRDLK